MASISPSFTTVGIASDTQHAAPARSSASTRVVPIDRKRLAPPNVESSAKRRLLQDADRLKLAHLQNVWVSRSRIAPARNTSNVFRMGLLTAWLTLARARPDLPRNAVAHLWSDRHPLKALYMPIAATGLPDLEIPHSMIDCAPVILHGPDSLDKLIERIPEPYLRHLAGALVHHVTAENVGVRKDLLTLILVGVYQAPVHRQQLNVHTDIDLVAGTHAMSLSNDVSPPLEAGEDDRLKLGEKEAVLAELLAPFPPATQDKLDKMAVRENVSDEGAGIVVPPRRRPLVSRYPSNRNQAEGGLARSMGVLINRGYANLEMENDMVSATPHHPRMWAVAHKISYVLTTGEWLFDSDPASLAHQRYRAGLGALPAEMSEQMMEMLNQFAEDARSLAATLHSMAHDVSVPDPNALSQQQRVDMFLLAERIRQSEPLLQDKIDVLRLTLENPQAAEHLKEKARDSIAAISGVYDWVGSFIEAFVNLHTYMPQIEHSDAVIDQEMRQFSRHAFGADPMSMKGDSWKSNKLEVPDGIEDLDFNLMEYREMFGEILGMLRHQPARTTYDIVNMGV